MFTQKHYVPILKTKSGERHAIRELSAPDKATITPVFELHPHATIGDIDHAKDLARKVASDWGATSTCFIDNVYVPGASVLTACFDEARGLGLQAIPVVHASSDLATLNAAKEIHGLDQRGVMLRIAADDLATSASALGTIPAYLGITLGSIDLMIDYGRHAMALASHVPLIPNVTAWRTFTAASGVFPGSLSTLPLHSWQPIQRYCWQSWFPDALSGALARVPTFSDYGTRSPGRPPSGGEPSVNVRYATTSQWQVRLGGKVKDGASPDIFPICSDLITQPYYSGAGFSSGDSTFNAVAAHAAGPGNSTNWVQWSLNHHLAFVARQIQNEPGL